MFQQVIEWIKQNPIPTIAIIVYLLANFAPRPHPEQQKGWVKALWTVIDRVCVLSTSAIPGRFKMFLAASPVPTDTRGAAADSAETKKKEHPNE